MAYATVKLLDPVGGKWTVAGFYKDAILPPEADPENVASLVRREYCEWLDKDDAVVVEEQETDADKAAAAAFEQRLAEGEAAAKEADEADTGFQQRVAADKAEADAKAAEQKATRPDGRASQATWLNYAVSQRPEGMSEEEAREEYGDMTKAELIAEFGGRGDLPPERPSAVARPAATASKDEWVAYAVTRRADGVSEVDAKTAAESKSKADLIAEFGS